MRIMKNIAFYALILVLFFSFTCTVLQQEINVGSKINHVYIYPNSAILAREAVLELDKGFYSIVFDDILEQFDENTIKAELEGVDDELANIKGVSVETVYIEEEPSIRIKQLQNEIQELEKNIRIITMQKNSLQDKKEFLNSIIYLFQEQRTKEDSTISIPSTEQLEEIYNFLDEKLRINYEQLLNQDFQIESYKDRVALLQKRLQQISNERRETKKVIGLDLEVFQKTNISILVSYLLNDGINWRPVYDLKTDLRNDRIAIVTYALIGQSTGVDWKNVQISLSTARPTISGQLPPIDSWFLRPYQIDENIQKSVGIMPMSARGELDAVYEDSVAEEEEQLIPVEYKGTSVTYKIPQKVSVPSGTSREKVMISEDELSGQFNYRAYPRKSPFVYFNVFVDNNLAVPLLPGEMNIFLEGGFTGNTSIGYIPPGNDFDVSLGIAENLKVERELVKKFRDETLIATIPSSKIATKYEYKITIENYQDMEAVCHIFESIPVSEDDRIQVNIDNISKEPQVKNWEDKEGVWMWEVLLEPQEKDEISIIYSVIHPRDIEIIGLP
jgi:uncharacterized protein (TIGR02231 family)